jgi:hypothetical protein
MNIVKLILLAFPAFLASVLLLVKPVQACLKAIHAANIIVLSSTQVNLDLTTSQINKITHSVIEKTGCSCANCVQTNLHNLQGKLPMIEV